jgi:DNA-binding transcriptional regulator/RsmH inhibitor MraZ
MTCPETLKASAAQPTPSSWRSCSQDEIQGGSTAPTREAAERKLLELANAVEADHAGRLSVAVINTQFRDAGGSYEEYGLAVKAAFAHGRLTLHPSGGYVMFAQAGADLFT